MAFLRNGSQQMGWPNYVQEILIGVIIVVAVAIDRWRHAQQGDGEMKLIRFGPTGRERSPACMLGDGTRIDASGFGEDWDERFFETDGLRPARRPGLRDARRHGPARARLRAARLRDHPPEQDRVHRPQLRRPRARDERQDPRGARHLLQGHDGPRRPGRRPRRCRAAR